MNVLDKLRIIESDVVPKEGALIEALSTSIKITHTCGCVLVEHFADIIPKYSQMSPKAEAERRYYVGLCFGNKKCDCNLLNNRFLKKKSITMGNDVEMSELL